MKAAMNIRLPYDANNFLTYWKSVDFLRRTVLWGWITFVLQNVNLA
jgi:hypothetical protein